VHEDLVRLTVTDFQGKKIAMPAFDEGVIELNVPVGVFRAALEVCFPWRIHKVSVSHEHIL
jgi:hypothetical protein